MIVGAFALTLALVAQSCERSRTAARGARDASTGATVGRVDEMESDGVESDSLARRGDLVLHGSDGASLVFATHVDEPGRRPLRGSVVDVFVGERASEGDPLIWWRPGLVLADRAWAPVIATNVARMRCERGGEGVKVVGDAAGARVETHVCPAAHGAFEIESRVLRAMPEGATLADELNTGASILHADRVGERWDERVETSWLAFGGAGVGVALDWAQPRQVERKVIRIAAEVFRAEARIPWGAARAVRTLRVARGDALSAISRLPVATRRVALRMADDRGGSVVLHDERGAPIATFARGGRSWPLALPPSLGATMSVRDHAGIVRVERAPIEGDLSLPHARVGVIRATYVDERGEGTPAKIIVRGIDGTEDPTFERSERRFAAHSTVYAVDGWAELPVRPGRYRVIGTRGPAYSLSVREVAVAEGASIVVRDVLRRELDASRYVAGDFHLHAAPSPDSSVSLPARVASLVCNGIELAVATDHNAVTDYGPAVRELGLERWLTTIAGDEVTTSGAALLGHFNVFPLAGSGHRAALPYHDVTAEQIVRDARRAGASIVQVNHGRMGPNIGYFELTEFDARTGRGGPRFFGGFDAFEAFNGMYLEQPERVREGVRDVVGLARAGIRAGVTGNSDSHHLVFEEAGWPRTYVRAQPGPDGTRATRVMQAVREGRTTVSSGPLVELWVDGTEPGDTLLRAGGARRVRARVRVSAASWVPVDRVELWVNDRVALEAAVPAATELAPSASSPDAGASRASGVRFDRTFDLSLSSDAVVLAWASAETPLPHVLPPYPQARAIGFTGPVWVDADGDGAVRVPPAPP